MPVIPAAGCWSKGDRIAALGRRAPPRRCAAEVIDWRRCADARHGQPAQPSADVAVPGLGEDVDDRLFRYILPLERRFVTPDMVRAGTALSALELIAGRVTTVADMYYFEAEVAACWTAPACAAVVGQTLADFAPPITGLSTRGSRWWRTGGRLARASAHHPLHRAACALFHRDSGDGPRGAWAEAIPTCRCRCIWPRPTENRWAPRAHGLTPVQVVAQAGLLRPGLICAHCLHVTPETSP
jgi:5-methylthioadenosine/S-adenosylhomocysteine deaminase